MKGHYILMVLTVFLLALECDAFQLQEYSGPAIEEESNNHSSRSRRAVATNIEDARWTDNIVPYEIRSEDFSQDEINIIKSGIHDWERFTCLSFIPCNISSRRIVFLDNGEYCKAEQIGMDGTGPQNISLSQPCIMKRVIRHLLGHALGLMNEHDRPDRSLHVRVIKNNIMPGMIFEYDILRWEHVLQYSIPYDFFSIMHYGNMSFDTEANAVTMETIDPRFQDIIGSTHTLSFRDIKTVNLMYKCRHVSKCALKDSACPGEDFVGKDCLCWCPSDDIHDTAKYCDLGGPSTLNCDDKKDTSTCEAWAKQGDCQRYPIYMYEYCRKTCQFCAGRQDRCEDKFYQCPTWASVGRCDTMDPDFIHQVCPVSCNKCPPHKCCDNSDNCTTMASNGECDSDPTRMNKDCPVACNACPTDCDDESDQCVEWAKDGGCFKNPVFMHKKCPWSCSLCVKPCMDKNKMCSRWADQGKCDTNPAYMHQGCPVSCGTCGGLPSSGFVALPTCSDSNDQCAIWASDGLCDTDQGRMHTTCRFSCNKCPQ